MSRKRIRSYVDPTDLMIDFEKMRGDMKMKMFFESIGQPIPTTEAIYKKIEKKMDHEGIYTKGNSFRALAENHARIYRSATMHLKDFDKYGHKLIERDANRGMNFLPSFRTTINEKVLERKCEGKGVALKRTRGNLLSSQAMCFNLFIPLGNNLISAANVFKNYVNDLNEIESIEIEKTPPKKIFGDQNNFSGVDCDVYIRYNTNDNRKGVLLIETKYVETGFSVCGHRKNERENSCSKTTIVLNSQYCKYTSVNKFNYWTRTEESNLFDIQKLKSNLCPFGDSKWQLWVNTVLSYHLAQNLGTDKCKFIVICPKGNTELTDNGKVIEQFKSLLKDQKVFEVIYLENIISTIEKELTENDNKNWIKEFKEKYLF